MIIFAPFGFLFLVMIYLEATKGGDAKKKEEEAAAQKKKEEEEAARKEANKGVAEKGMDMFG